MSDLVVTNLFFAVTWYNYGVTWLF